MDGCSVRLPRPPRLVTPDGIGCGLTGELDPRLMNYRHAYHAGNFADVVKHVALVAILLHLKKKDTAFAVIDTHAGRGLYDLKSDEAARTGEAVGGIDRLAAVDHAPAALGAYLELVRSFGPHHYPGSPLIAARLLRPADRLVAIEKHPEETAALVQSLGQFRKARVVHGDGYAMLPGLLPPLERRGLVLIDPPYESPSEFRDAGRALARAHGRFATGIYLLWFPTKSAADADLLCGELLTTGIARLLRLDIDTAAGARAQDGALQSAGLLIANPPFGMFEELRACLEMLEPLLGAAPGGRARSEICMLTDA